MSNLGSVPSVPARLWKRISTGAPRSRQASWVLMWASTQICVGAPVARRSSSRCSSSRETFSTVSIAGLTPMRPSPAPSDSPR